MTPVRAHGAQRGDGTKRDAFVAAAVRVLARDGVSALTTRRIADEAKLPAGIFHYWFASKADLLEAVLRAALDGAAATAAKSAIDSADRARYWKAAVSEASEDGPGSQLGVYELVAMALRNDELRDIPRQFYRSYHDVARTELDPFVDELNSAGAGLDHDTVARLVTGLVDGLVFTALANPDATPPPGEVLDLAFRLLTAMGTRPDTR